MEDEIVKSAMSAIASTFGKQATEISIDQVKTWFSKASASDYVDFNASKGDDQQIETLAQDILNSEADVFDSEITKKNLARWFEIPDEEFSKTPVAQLEPDVMIKHIFLEDMFKKWMTEWGYKVQIGEDLEGLEGIDFTPDIMAELTTLHGKYEVFINFVCDDPPSQYRVRALLETLESYATDGSQFKWGDIYILATPTQFLKGASASIRLQSLQEKYTVIQLEGDDIYRLQNARDKNSRLIQLMEYVEKSRLEGPQR